MSGEAIAFVVVFVGLAWFALVRFHRAPTGDDAGLPTVLRGATLAYAERSFRSHKRRLVARLDRAYRTADQGLVLVELKTRSRDEVYLADIIELSVQRLAVQDETGEGVSRQAWVVVEDPASRSRRPHKVQLLAAEEVTALQYRYRALRGGGVAAPAPASTQRQCLQCGHRGRCAATFGDRG
jgi:hypothetical protein